MRDIVDLSNLDVDNAVHVVDADEQDFTPYGYEEGTQEDEDTIPQDAQTEPAPETNDETSEEEESLITQYLKKRNVADPSKIKYEGENGEVEERDFNSMTIEEQLDILEQVSSVDLSDHETEVVNYLRQNNKTFDEIIDYFAEQRLQEYLTANPEQTHQQSYRVDDYSDDELYLADLKSKFNSFSDEELETKLNTAKGNEELYKKEVDFLRQSYKDAEEAENKAIEEQRVQAYESFKNRIADAASAFNEVSLDYSDPESDSLIIEDEDKHQIISYLLDPGPEGRSKFELDLDDPQTLIQLAWFKTQGQDVISGISKYWKDILKAERKEMAELKKQLGKTEDKTTTVVKTSTEGTKKGDKSQPIS